MVRIRLLRQYVQEAPHDSILPRYGWSASKMSFEKLIRLRFD